MDIVIYRDVRVPIFHKCWHIHSVKGKYHKDFTKDYGDVPVGRFNNVTNKFEECVNGRGKAYGARKRLKYRKRYRRLHLKPMYIQ